MRDHNDDTISAAFSAAEEKSFRICTENTSVDWIPSAQFEKKMKKLIHSADNPCWKFVNTTPKRIFCIAAAILFLFSLSMSVAAIREPVIGFITQTYEKFTSILFPQSNKPYVPDNIEEKYAIPSYAIPEGYFLDYSNSNIFSNEATYKNANGSFLLFQQFPLYGLVINLDTEGVVCENYNIGEHEGIFYANKENSNLLWKTDEYQFVLVSSEKMSAEELIHIAQSIAIQ